MRDADRFAGSSVKEETRQDGLIVPAARAVAILRGEKNTIDEFHIDAIDTLCKEETGDRGIEKISLELKSRLLADCQLDCSGHGTCSNFSKQCDCDPYWMANPINAFLFVGRREDCGK